MASPAAAPSSGRPRKNPRRANTLRRIGQDAPSASAAPGRDHAIIRVLAEGVRRTELAQMEVSDLSADTGAC